MNIIANSEQIIPQLKKGQIVYVAYTEFNWWEIKSERNTCFYEEKYIPQIFGFVPYLCGKVDEIDHNNTVYIKLTNLEQDAKPKFKPYTTHSILHVHRITHPQSVIIDKPENLVTRQSNYNAYCRRIYMRFLLDKSHPYTIDDLNSEAKEYLSIALSAIKQYNYISYRNLISSKTNVQQINKFITEQTTLHFNANADYTCTIPLNLFAMFSEENGVIHGKMKQSASDSDVYVTFKAEKDSRRVEFKIPPTLFMKFCKWVTPSKELNKKLNNKDISIRVWEKLVDLSDDLKGIQKLEGKGMFHIIKYYNILLEHRVWYWWSMIPPVTSKTECVDEPLILNEYGQKVLVCQETKQVFVPLNAINWWETLNSYITMSEQMYHISNCSYQYIVGTLKQCKDMVCIIDIPFVGYLNMKIDNKYVEHVNAATLQERSHSCVQTEMEFYHFTMGFIYRKGVIAYFEERYLNSNVEWNEDILDEVHEITVFKTFLRQNVDRPDIKEMFLATQDAKTMYEVIYHKNVRIEDLMNIFKFMLIQQYDLYDQMRFTNNVVIQCMLDKGFVDMINADEVKSTFYFDGQFNKVLLRNNDERTMAFEILEHKTAVLEIQTLPKKHTSNFYLKFKKDLQMEGNVISVGDTISRFNGSKFNELFINNAKMFYYPRDLLFALEPSLKPPTIDEIIGPDLMITESLEIHWSQDVYYKLNLLISYADTLHDFGQGTTTTMHMEKQKALLNDFIPFVVRYVATIEQNIKDGDIIRIVEANDSDAQRQAKADYLRMLVEGKHRNFEAKLLDYFNQVYLATKKPNTCIDLVQLFDDISNKKTTDKAFITTLRNMVASYQQGNVMSIRMGQKPTKEIEEDSFERTTKKTKKKNGTGLYSLEENDRKEVMEVLIKLFLGTEYGHCMINMTNINSRILPGVAYSTATEFDRGVSKDSKDLLHMKKIEYHISQLQNELFDLDYVAVKKDNNLYMKQDREFVVDIGNNKCKPKKDMFKEILRIKNDGGYNFLDAVNIIRECYPSVYDSKPVLLDIKRSGDMLSSSSIMKWNKTSSKQKVVFLSGDYLAVLKARMLGVPVIHTMKQENDEYWFYIYKPYDMVIENVGGGYNDDVDMEPTTPEQEKMSTRSINTIPTRVIESNLYYSKVIANILLMDYNNRVDAKLLLLLWVYLSSKQMNGIYVDSFVLEAKQNYDKNGIKGMIFYILAKDAVGFQSIITAYAQELSLMKDNIELLHMPMQKEFMKSLMDFFGMNIYDHETMSYAMDVIDSLGYVFKWMEPKHVMKNVIYFTQTGFDVDAQAKAKQILHRLLKRHGISENDIIPIKYYESGIQDYLDNEDVDYENIIEYYNENDLSSSMDYASISMASSSLL